MAGFNWFQRGFDKSNSADADAKKDEAKAPEPAQAPAPATPQLSSEDYLKWAKAAYQNIQKQQAEVKTEDAVAETAPAEAAEEAAAEVEEADAEASEVSVADEPVVETEIAEPAETLDAETDAAISESLEIAESAVEPSVVEPAAEAEVPTEEPAAVKPEPEPEPAPEPATPRPFWAQTEEERQHRLAQLEAMAIAEPEPAPVAAVTAPPAPVLPDIDLDEAFLWSAEVLAAQGRRPDDISAEEITWLNKLRQGLNKTRLGLVNQLKAIVGQGPLNDDAVMEIEALLLQADVGVAATDKVIEALQARMRQEVLPPDQAIAYLKSILRDMLDAPLADSHNLAFTPEKGSFNIWLMTGVNGAGKTTTIGKLAHIAKKSGYNTLIAAADTFRAAAVEQVKTWGARSNVEVIANPGQNTDPAAVVYDAIAASQSRNIELLLVDTAGRLQNKKNLMDELAKIRRIIDKKAPDAQVEALLVLDATLGQNGLRQAEVFAEAANLSGVVLTKLDGTAKGGVALAVVEQLGLPIRFIGAGEGIEDLRPFSSYEFVEALVSG
ncbi:MULTISPECIES: signal recognition particle-docking protein FtsY [Cyanophyceae]|uniref:signal recognition particle-docking protein FtsY n=1 Tax=Cyanophyceae TaxID=3028117 RepID=UPI001689F04E|nr:MULTISPECIES: signal recognition particle-docking protein FtsY [Cyanophyceae]MBD1918757.1 signal recognition particle-docking protein FtsY [Phormidium sp. FACHB-77]MBD2033410.1 signal recognition particle-docking protein FtsY [Phormidium sp. FACHB-322]MBD2053909.1 signal recognition particle-docking protein FtsY [Leptolyngbya sp. FACHB-60]